MALTIRSAGWEAGERIPVRFTADGEDVSPAVRFTGATKEAQAFALVFDDPDAPMGTWVHWVLYNIPGTVLELSEGLPRSELLPNGMAQGRNSWDTLGYRGPSPPPGKPHRYIFHLYALARPVGLAPGLTAAKLEALVKPHVVATATYLGTYGRDAPKGRSRP